MDFDEMLLERSKLRSFVTLRASQKYSVLNLTSLENCTLSNIEWEDGGVVIGWTTREYDSEWRDFISMKLSYEELRMPKVDWKIYLSDLREVEEIKSQAEEETRKRLKIAGDLAEYNRLKTKLAL